MSVADEVSARGLGVALFNFILGKDMYWGAYSRFHYALPRSQVVCGTDLFAMGWVLRRGWWSALRVGDGVSLRILCPVSSPPFGAGVVCCDSSKSQSAGDRGTANDSDRDLRSRRPGRHDVTSSVLHPSGSAGPADNPRPSMRKGSRVP